MELEGKIIIDLPLQEGTSKAGNPWKKKEWVLETFGNYPRRVKFDTFGDRVDTIKPEVGKSYKVQVDAESREFNGRWYTDLRAYAIQEIAAPGVSGAPAGYSAPQQPQQAPFGAPPAAQAPVDPFDSGSNDTDDLPF